MSRVPRALGALLMVAAGAALAAPASAAPPTNTQALQDAVKVGNGNSGIRRHLKELQKIADRPGANGTRATGTQGHEDSVAYVKQQLEATGYYNVTTQPFVASVFTQLGPSTLSTTPTPSGGWVEGENFDTMEFSGNGAVSGKSIVSIDFTEPTTTASASSSGCEASDFPAGGIADKVALIQRGTCDFGLKVVNAQAAGAVGVIIFNEGTLGDPDRNGLIGGTLGGYTINVPVLETTYAAGRLLHDAFVGGQNPTASLSASTRTDNLQTRNLIAETKTGRADRTVIVGAHLDSVPEGPGINDDGSGTSTDLEVALQMAKLKIKPVNQVRFIWFAGEEQGLLGSTFYADNLTKKQISSTSAMLDFDMLASPNYAKLIYDGDGSEFGTAGPNGSGAIERVFQDFFDRRGSYTERIPFDGRSDYDEFTVVGIPAGGIFTGAEVHKSPFQQTQWGGTVSDTLKGQFDPCYHLACDSYGINGHPDNINDEVLSEMSDAVAHAVLTFAQSTSAVNGTSQGSSSSTKPYAWKGDHLVR
jgi:Zn-dependent M28 family amino/carboxypeptidase